MGSEANKKLSAAMLGAAIKNKAAKKSNRARNRKVRPWKVLREEWFEEASRVFGVQVDVPKWGAAEEALARKLLTEVSLDRAIDMMKRFMARQNDRGEVPHFKLFWTLRGTLRARSEGSIQSRREAEKRKREWNDEDDADLPDIGW